MPKYEFRISNKIYENRTYTAQSEDEAWELAEADIKQNAHVNEEDCDGPGVDELWSTEEDDE